MPRIMPCIMKKLVWFFACVASASAQIDPQIYAKIFGINQPAWNKMSQLVKDSVPAGGTVLDVGAGPGEPTTTMANSLPSHIFVTTDSQEAMVEKAKVRAQGLRNVEQFVVAKAEDLSVFKEASFDAATGCYVLMFVDVSKALTELARVLKPGGLGFFSVWIDMPFYSLPQEALKKLFAKHGYKGDVPNPPVNPMALSPTEHGVSSVEAGLDGMAEKSLHIKNYETISYEFYFGSMQDTCAATGVLFPGIFAKIAEDNATTEGQVKSSFCKILTDIIESKPDWKKTDGSYSLGHSSAGIYTLEKLAGKSEL